MPPACWPTQTRKKQSHAQRRSCLRTTSRHFATGSKLVDSLNAFQGRMPENLLRAACLSKFSGLPHVLSLIGCCA